MKKDASINTPTAPQLRVLKTAACPTLSGKGKGTLTYHIGCTPDSEVHFRIASNSGGGYFSPEWVSLKSILEAFDKGPKPLTSFALWPLFNGKSVNTPGFIFAALKNEGLVQSDEENPRCYVSVAPKAFIAEIKKLIASDVDIKVAAKVVGKGVVKGRPKAADVVPIVEPSKVKPKVEDAAPIVETSKGPSKSKKAQQEEPIVEPPSTSKGPSKPKKSKPSEVESPATLL